MKCTAIFDPSIDNNGTDRAMVKEEGLVEILEDYARFFGVEFGIANWQFFKKDVARRMAHKKPYQRIGNDKQLDIMIVVDQMLTGFDSKWVNTLYVDKMLAYEGLIQAFSRTNRLFGHDKRFGIIRYYRRPHKMERNIEIAFETYAHGRPDGVFVSKIGHNIGSMNHHFEEIKYMFDRAHIEDFSQLPVETPVRARFASEWRLLNAALDAAKMQGFVWSKKRYKWTDDEGKKRVATIAFDEATYLTLAQRYKELHQSSSSDPRTGSEEEVPYEIESYLVEIDTGHIDSAYMNSRFQKYLESFYNDEEKEVIDAVDKELHSSFAHLSAEDQKYANIFLNDIQQGRVNREDIDPDKSLSDYIEDYKASAKNDQIHRFAETFGVDEDKLREIIALHLPENNLNQGGHYNELIATLNKIKARDFLQHLNGGRPVPPFQVTAKADKLLREFIVCGGYDIDDLFDEYSVRPYSIDDNDTVSIAAEP